MRPRVARIFEDSWIARAKSPVISVSAATKRLPKLWPLRASPPRKRWLKRRARSASSSLRATMQLRRSPGGNMLKPLRNLPDEPPSSVTVTTAARSVICPGEGLVWPVAMTWRRRPRSNVERPVPPPIATTRRGRVKAEGSEPGEGTEGSSSFKEFEGSKASLTESQDTAIQ